MTRRSAFSRRTLAAAGAAFLLATPQASAAGPKIANIINFIRGTEPRANVDLVQPVREQIQLAKQHNLPSTFLLQYDALVNPTFTNLLKSQLGPNDEIGVWLEVVQPQVEAAGLVWKGRWVWDYNAAVGLTEAYTVEERKKLMDVLMERFKTEFGYYPKSVGCWVLDAPTLNYLYDKYHIVAACNCKDQSGTDGYTLWGGYWNQAYYPSRLNAFMPAQTADQQLNVPIFRMLGSDPVYQYDNGLGGIQGVISLEPVYQPGGGSPNWVRWFFDANFKSPCLSFAYTQAGQENSFGWPAMSAGLADQYTLMQQMRDQGTLQVETLAQSGTWYRSNFDKTPASSVVAMSDYDSKGHRSIWYESRYYRVNLYWEGNAWRVRDLHVFNENYPERYLNSRVTGSTCTYDTLPVMDGHHWSTSADYAGIRPLVNTASGTRQLMANGTPTVTEVGTDALLVTMPVTSGGELKIHCNPTNLSFEVTGAGAPSDWGMELGWNAQQQTSIVNFTPKTVGYQHNNFGYALRTTDSTISQGTSASRLLIKPSAQSVSLDFDPANSTSYWDLNGSGAGAGSATASGTWDASSLNWTTSPEGTADTVAWQGAGHTAVFAAGTDATGTYTVNVSGTQTADGVTVKQGNVTLSGGSLNLTTPAVIRAEAGAGLNLATQLTGSGGLLVQGDGSIHLSGSQPFTGPMGISATNLTLDSGASFPGLSSLSLASGAALTGDSLSMTLTGALLLGDATFNGKGATTVNARSSTISGGNLALSESATLRLTSPSPAQSTFEIDGGTVSLSGSAALLTDRWTNRGSGQSHTLTIADSSTLTITDDFILGGNSGAPITINQTGGTVTNTGTTNNPGGDDASNRWGLWGDNATATYNISGGSLSLTGAPLYLSWDSPAALNISGTATVNLRGVEMGWNNRSQASAINLTGGRLNIGAAGITSGNGSNKTINLGTATLGATAAWSSALPMTVSGAVTMNTTGGNISISGALTGPGSVTKAGTGVLALTGANNVAGGITASTGTLRIGGTSSATVSIATGASLTAGNESLQGTGTVGVLNLAAGSESAFRVGGPANSITVSSSGGLRPSGTHVVNVVPVSGLTPGTYTLFRYSGAIGGNGAAAFALGSAPRMTASIVNNAANSSIDLVVTAVEPVDPGAGSGVFIQELFDGIAGTPPGTNASINGKGDTTSSLGMSGVWATNGSTGIFTASNFNTGAGLPGLPASNGVDGGIWNNTNSYTTTIYATRPLAAPVSFAQDRTLYFSFRANNSGDTAMGVGFASGPGSGAEFVGAGLTWNNARSLATGQIDASNASYIAYGTLGANSGPYGVRNHEAMNSVNGAALIVGRLTLKTTGPDLIDIKRYGVGDSIESDPSAVVWSARDSVTSSMSATHLLLWLNGTNGGAAGELDAIRVGSSWSDVTGAVSGYDAWIAGSPYYLSGSDASPSADPDRDGIPNAIEFILGTSPTSPSDRSRLPEAVLSGGNIEFSFRRAAASNATPLPSVEYGSSLTDWTTAQDGSNGISISATSDFYGAGIDRVVVKIPQSLAQGQKLFARLNANR